MANKISSFVGSWTANRRQQLYANSIVSCDDTLILDADGRMFRQYRSVNYVFKEGGAKDEFDITITLVGNYEVKGDRLVFKNVAPRLDENSYSYTPAEDEKDVDQSAIEASGRAKLECKIAEVLMNRAMECRQNNLGKLPTCHAKVEGNLLVMAWEGYEGQDQMAKCDEPANFDRLREPTTIDIALKAPETRFMNALENGDCHYLNNATLYTPCDVEEGVEGGAIAFTPLEIGDQKYMITFTDIHRLKSSSLNTSTGWRPTLITELASFSKVFDGLCLNPHNGHSVGLTSEMVDAIVGYTWEGTEEEEEA